MTAMQLPQAAGADVELILGHLNFSDGEMSVPFYQAMNSLYAYLREQSRFGDHRPTWQMLREVLFHGLETLEKKSPVFNRSEQVRKVLTFVLVHFIPLYRKWHRNILFHQPDDTIFQAFFMAHLFQTVLRLKTYHTIDFQQEASENLTLPTGSDGLDSFFSKKLPENQHPRVTIEGDLLAEDAFLQNIPETDEFLFDVTQREAFLQSEPGAYRRAVAEAFLKTNDPFDDFVGYRPVPVLRTHQKMQPYDHEWVRAVPIYLKDAGVERGRYDEIVSGAIKILADTPEDLLRAASLDLDMMEELAIDPRAIDFEHPVNRRLNYHFGGWDPLAVNNRGYYRRFVLIEATLNSILSRVDKAAELGIPRQELMHEASAVLAGTMLMASAVVGWGPGAHDSSVNFGTLLPGVAQLRDQFYQQLMKKMTGQHATRLREEMLRFHQPFAEARQYFNTSLARMRAEQYQNVQLARLYSWMGYTRPANDMLAGVCVASVRMRCEVDCLLTMAHVNIDRKRMREAIPMLYRIERILCEGVRCGAFVDPWYILGFSGQFPLSESIEDSVTDHRVEEFASRMGSIFSLYSRIMKEAAAQGLEELKETLSSRMLKLADWWDQFGSEEILETNGISGQETWESTQQVVSALEAWYKGGTATGDILFWRPIAADFSSAKAYVLLIEALLDQKDLVAAMALLITWLSQSEIIPLEDGDYSIHPLMLRWMEDLWYPPSKEQRLLCRRGERLVDGWQMAKKFIDYVEANADIYSMPPELEVDSVPKKRPPGKAPMAGDDMLDDPDFGSSDDDSLGFGDDDSGDLPEDMLEAAWENVTYKDTTDDGVDAEMMEFGAAKDSMKDFPLTVEAERVSDRLLFFITQARLWKMSAIFSIRFAANHPQRSEALRAWAQQADRNYLGLQRLLKQVQAFEIEDPLPTPSSLMDYEKRRSLKDSLLERIISTCSELLDAKRLMAIADIENRITVPDTWETATQCIMQALICGEAWKIPSLWEHTLKLLLKEPLLYRPLSRGGDPQRIVRTRSVLTVLQRLLYNLPQQGLLPETLQVLALAQQMERQHPAGVRSITRYDHLFQIGCKSVVRALLLGADTAGLRDEDTARPPTPHTPPAETALAEGHAEVHDSQELLLENLEKLVGILMKNWLVHSRGIRISAMDSITNNTEWEALKDFIQTYGNELFAPTMMSYGNLQAIHHQGVVNWLESLMEEEFPEMGASLAEDLNSDRISAEDVEIYMEIILEALLERYGEFIDYNSTTTQSDKGENLYILLDFLRIRAQYDRQAWEMFPIVNVHSAMVRNRFENFAGMGMTRLMQGYQKTADRLLKRYNRLHMEYGVAIKSIKDRLEERFSAFITINCLQALLEPSVLEARAGGDTPSFRKFLRHVQTFVDNPTGTGFELPRWLEEIEEEVQRYRNKSEDDDEMLDLKDFIPHVPLRQTELQTQLVLTETMMDTMLSQFFTMDTDDMPAINELRKILARLNLPEELPEKQTLMLDKPNDLPDEHPRPERIPQEMALRQKKVVLLCEDEFLEDMRHDQKPKKPRKKPSAKPRKPRNETPPPEDG